MTFRSVRPRHAADTRASTPNGRSVNLLALDTTQGGDLLRGRISPAWEQIAAPLRADDARRRRSRSRARRPASSSTSTAPVTPALPGALLVTLVVEDPLRHTHPAGAAAHRPLRGHVGRRRASPLPGHRDRAAARRGRRAGPAGQHGPGSDLFAGPAPTATVTSTVAQPAHRRAARRRDRRHRHPVPLDRRRPGRCRARCRTTAAAALLGDHGPTTTACTCASAGAVDLLSCSARCGIAATTFAAPGHRPGRGDRHAAGRPRRRGRRRRASSTSDGAPVPRRRSSARSRTCPGMPTRRRRCWSTATC